MSLPTNIPSTVAAALDELEAETERQLAGALAGHLWQYIARTAIKNHGRIDLAEFDHNMQVLRARLPDSIARYHQDAVIEVRAELVRMLQ